MMENYKKIKLTKLAEAPNPLHPNNIEVGFEKIGLNMGEPVVGEPYWVGMGWRTSPVVEIIDPTTFRTLNSIYKIEYL